MVDLNRKLWNEQMQELQRALVRSGDHQITIDLFLKQHAKVHAAEVGQSGLWSFDDELWQGLSEEESRCIPPKGEHSIVWMLWHIARCEDITMNLLVAGGAQVLHSGGWLERMKISACDTGSAMSVEEIAGFSVAVDVPAVRGYRSAVGLRTREIARQLPAGVFKKKMDPVRMQRVAEEGAVVEQAGWLIEYWRGRTVGGLLSMAATRHIFLHLNEATRVKQLIQKNRA